MWFPAQLYMVASNAKIFASATIFETLQYSSGWCATSSTVLHSAAGIPCFLKNAAQLPPPIPPTVASKPLAPFNADFSNLTMSASVYRKVDHRYLHFEPQIVDW